MASVGVLVLSDLFFPTLCGFEQRAALYLYFPTEFGFSDFIVALYLETFPADEVERKSFKHEFLRSLDSFKLKN